MRIRSNVPFGSTVPQVLATLYKVMGIDPAMTFPNGTGRPMYVLDDRDPVEELV